MVAYCSDIVTLEHLTHNLEYSAELNSQNGKACASFKIIV